MVEPVGVLAHHKLLMMAYGGFELALERSKSVDERLKELGSLRAALNAGCTFCIDIGSAYARKGGASERQVRELAMRRDSDAYDATERLVLELADGMTSTPVEVSDELFAALRERFDERQLVELCAAIAWENFRARFNWSFGIGPAGFAAEASCPIPDGVALAPH